MLRRFGLLGILGLALTLGLAAACAQATPTPAPTPTTVKTFPTVAPTATATAPAATPTTTAATPASGAGDAAAGKTIFTANCDACHPGGKQGVGPALAPVIKEDPQAEVIATIKAGKGVMPPFGSKFSDKDLADIYAFLKTLQ